MTISDRAILKRFAERLALRCDNVQRGVWVCVRMFACASVCVRASAVPPGLCAVTATFARTASAWQYVRSRAPADGMIKADQFHKMVDQVFCIGFTDEEIKALIRAMDTDNNGAIDFQEFQAIVMPALAPAVVSVDCCTGLPISKSIAQEHKSRGKGSRFHYDMPVSFNNKFRQTLDETGQPLLKNIFSGVFEKTDKLNLDAGASSPEIVQRRAEGKRTIRPDNFEFSRELKVPMVQAVLQGSWYGEKSGPGPIGQALSKVDRDCIREHRRTMNGYSQVVKSIKPQHRKSPPPSLRSGSMMSFSPLLSQTASQVSRSKQFSALDQAETFATSAAEVDNRYELRDLKAAASMAQYLSGASPKEKQRYLRLVAKANVNDSLSHALEDEARASSENRLAGDLKGAEGKFLRKTNVRVSSTVRSRPSSRPASSLGILMPRNEAIPTYQAQDAGVNGQLESGAVVPEASTNVERPASVMSGALPRQGDYSHESILNEAIKFRRSMRANARPESALSSLKPVSALPRPSTAMMMPVGRGLEGQQAYRQQAYLTAAHKSHKR